MKELCEREEFERDGRSPFGDWFERLNAEAAAKITIALTRLKEGKHSNVKSVGGGVAEYKIDFGPGYRIYFGKDGEKLIILLCGGDKKAQSNDVKKAKVYWQEYKYRKKQEAQDGTNKEV
jgi:putative addiction module killer protein